MGLLLAIGGACGDSETSGGSVSPAPDARAAEDAPYSVDAAAPADAAGTEDGEVGRVTERAAAAICDALYRCCNAGDREDYFAAYRANELLAELRDQLPPDAELSEQECPGLVRQMLDITPFGDWVAQAQAGRVSFDPVAFANCVSTLAATSCGAEVREALHDSTCFGFAPPGGGSEQRSFFERTGAAGATCAPIRDGVGAGFFGTCDPTSHFCCYQNEDDPGIGCTYPFQGDGTAREGTCTAASGVGQACSATPPIQLCFTGLSCDADTLTCAASSDTALAVGDTCVDEGWNLLGTCVDSWCDLFGSSECEPLEDNGASCSADYECAAGACLDLHCAESTMCVAPDEGGASASGYQLDWEID